MAKRVYHKGWAVPQEYRILLMCQVLKVQYSKYISTLLGLYPGDRFVGYTFASIEMDI